eukprot:gene28084-31724_t
MSKSALDLLNDLIAELENAVESSTVKETASNKKEAKEKLPVPPKQPKVKAESKKVAAAPTPSDQKEAININAIDLRVGIIRKVTKHETAEKLYCEEIDVGEDAPRAIASGLVPYYSLEQMQDR